MTLVSPSLPKMPNSKLNTFEMLAIFFMRIRLNLYKEDIAIRCTSYNCISMLLQSFGCNACQTVPLDKVARERETLHKTLPSSFRRFCFNAVLS